MSNSRKEIVNKIYQTLLNNLLEDLGDSSKCGPGLYQVVRGVMQDNREILDALPSDSIDNLTKKLAESAPFKFTSSKIA